MSGNYYGYQPTANRNDDYIPEDSLPNPDERVCRPSDLDWQTQWDSHDIVAMWTMVQKESDERAVAVAEMWRRMSALLQATRDNLQRHADALAAQWTSEAGRLFMEQVGAALYSLDEWKQVADNHKTGVEQIAMAIETAQKRFKPLWEEYLAAERKEQEDRSGSIWNDFNPFSSHAYNWANSLDEVKARFHQRAKDIVKPLADLYFQTSTSRGGKYKGPKDAVITNPDQVPRYGGPTAPSGMRQGKPSTPSPPPGLVPGLHLAGAGAPPAPPTVQPPPSVPSPPPVGPPPGAPVLPPTAGAGPSAGAGRGPAPTRPNLPGTNGSSNGGPGSPGRSGRAPNRPTLPGSQGSGGPRTAPPPGRRSAPPKPTLSGSGTPPGIRPGVPGVRAPGRGGAPSSPQLPGRSGPAAPGAGPANPTGPANPAGPRLSGRAGQSAKPGGPGTPGRGVPPAAPGPEAQPTRPNLTGRGTGPAKRPGASTGPSPSLAGRREGMGRPQARKTSRREPEVVEDLVYGDGDELWAMESEAVASVEAPAEFKPQQQGRTLGQA